MMTKSEVRDWCEWADISEHKIYVVVRPFVDRPDENKLVEVDAYAITDMLIGLPSDYEIDAYLDDDDDLVIGEHSE